MSVESYKRIHDLGSEIVHKIMAELQKNSVAKVARMVQDDWGLCSNVAKTTFYKQLLRFNADVVLTGLAASLTAGGSATTVKKIQKNFDVTMELQDLCVTQKQRVAKLLVREGDMPDGILIAQATQEMKAYADMLDKLSKLMLETGIMVRAPKVIEGVIGQGGMSPGDVDTVWFRVTEETHNMLEVLDNEFGHIKTVN